MILCDPRGWLSYKLSSKLYLHCTYVLNLPVVFKASDYVQKRDSLPETFVEALVDGSAKMPCNVIQRKDDGVEFIFWYKNDGVTALYTLDARDRRLANATHMRNETYSDRVHFHVTGDVPYLQMDYLKEEDTGSYFCRVDYQWSATELKRVNLVVVVVRIASMSKLSNLDAFNHGQIVGDRHMIYFISEIVRQLGFSRSTVSVVHQEYMGGGQKIAIGQTAKNN
ncbi:transposable element Tcb1 transposase [Trichonephila clavipes]|nr:transposable element Tcb1 transposase [Trichonephila clavipes]